MKMSLSIHRYIYLLFFALIFQSIYPGFAAGTLVRTPLGYKNIENLNIGDFIYSYDTRGNTYVDIIKHISTHQNARSFGVMVEDYFVTVSPDQRFYLPNEKKWRKAKDLLTDDVILISNKNTASVKLTICFEDEIQFFDITLENIHAFCVTTKDIVVHNLSEDEDEEKDRSFKTRAKDHIEGLLKEKLEEKNEEDLKNNLNKNFHRHENKVKSDLEFEVVEEDYLSVKEKIAITLITHVAVHNAAAAQGLLLLAGGGAVAGGPVTIIIGAGMTIAWVYYVFIPEVKKIIKVKVKPKLPEEKDSDNKDRTSENKDSGSNDEKKDSGKDKDSDKKGSGGGPEKDPKDKKDKIEKVVHKHKDRKGYDLDKKGIKNVETEARHYENRNLKSEPNKGKHTINSSGKIGKAPKNEAAALLDSYKVPGEKCRISVMDGEIVKFFEHQGENGVKVWHGFVVAGKEAINALPSNALTLIKDLGYRLNDFY